MGLYSKPSLDLLGELINRDNPDFKAVLNHNNFMVLNGPFTVGANGRNTRIVVNGRTGSGVVGKKEFYYDRMNIGSLFNGITVVFAAKGDSATVADLLPSLNEQYGLGLTADDIANPTTKLGTGYQPTAVAITMATTSVAFTGTLNVVWTRTPVGEFPDSGPGSKVMLVGDLETGGYFGKVTAAEMMPASEIFNQLLAPSNGQGANGSNPGSNLANLFWVKFAYKGKYLFFPSTHIAQTSWKNLYMRGAVYGDGTTGKIPPADTALVAQNTVLVFDQNEGAFGFIPRLPTFHENDPAPSERSKLGEMGVLIQRIFTGTYAAGDWDQLTQGTGAGSFDTSTAMLWQNSREGAETTAWVSPVSAVSTSSASKETNTQWRPFLELIDLRKIVLPLYEITSKVEGRLRAPVLTIDQTRDPEMLVRLDSVTGKYELPFKRPSVWHVTAEPELAIADIRSVPSPKGVDFTYSVNVDKRTNLSTTNGELDGF